MTINVAQTATTPHYHELHILFLPGLQNQDLYYTPNCYCNRQRQ